MKIELLIVDANVLIDFCKTDASVLTLVTKHIGTVHVAEPVLAEVRQLDRVTAEGLGLHVVQAEFALLAKAANASVRSPRTAARAMNGAPSMIPCNACEGGEAGGVAAGAAGPRATMGSPAGTGAREHSGTAMMTGGGGELLQPSKTPSDTIQSTCSTALINGRTQGLVDHSIAT